MREGESENADIVEPRGKENRCARSRRAARAAPESSMGVAVVDTGHLASPMSSARTAASSHSGIAACTVAVVERGSHALPLGYVSMYFTG